MDIANKKIKPSDKKDGKVSTAFKRGVPEEFATILRSLRGADKFCSANLVETEAPKKMAKYAISIDGSIPERASARFTVIYDPSKEKSWGGRVRVITYIEADILKDFKPSQREFSEKLWSTYEKELKKAGAFNAGASFSISTDYYYGEDINPQKALLKDTETTTFEMRVSWTIDELDLTKHIRVWDRMIFNACSIKYEPVPVLAIV